jgi:hypothetical protein
MTLVSRLDGSAGIGGWQEVVAKLEVPRLRVGVTGINTGDD